MRNYIKGLENKKIPSNWDNYSEKNTYTFKEEERKLEIVKKFVDENRIGFLADLGCNEGKYSEYASKQKKLKLLALTLI